MNICVECDVLIVGCGGGFLEDLWCFNYEIVVCIIVVSEILIISVVGYEIDVMIVDFVVDVCVFILLVVVELVSCDYCYK